MNRVDSNDDKFSYSVVVSKGSSRSSSRITSAASSRITSAATSRITSPATSSDNLNSKLSKATTRSNNVDSSMFVDVNGSGNAYVSDEYHQSHYNAWRADGDAAHRDWLNRTICAKGARVEKKGMERAFADYFREKAEASRVAKDHAHTMAALHICLLKNKNIALDVTSDNKLVFLGFTKRQHDKSYNIIDAKKFEIDLHCLTTLQAKSLVLSIIKYIQQRVSSIVNITFIVGNAISYFSLINIIIIITGIGNNSNGFPKLPGVVLKIASDLCLKHTINSPGTIVIEVPPPINDTATYSEYIKC